VCLTLQELSTQVEKYRLCRPGKVWKVPRYLKVGVDLDVMCDEYLSPEKKVIMGRIRPGSG